MPYQKKIFRGASTDRKLTGISVFNAKRPILQKLMFHLVFHFYLGKYGIALDTFWTHVLETSMPHGLVLRHIMHKYISIWTYYT